MASVAQTKIHLSLIAVQASILAYLLWGGIGFDLPGTFGLTFEHAFVLTAIYVLVFIYSAFQFVSSRRYIVLACQSLLLALALLIAFLR